MNSITTQPTTFQTAAAGSSVTLRVVADGEALSYQWRRNGVAIPGATLTSLTRPAVSASDTGSYTVLVTGAGGSAT